jgi:hypothetical protein
LFIPQVIYEYGESRWNVDVGRGKLLIRLPDFSGNSTSSDLVTKEEKHSEEMLNLAYKVCLFILVG